MDLPCRLLCLDWSKMVTPVDLKKAFTPLFFSFYCSHVDIYNRVDACEEIHLGLILKLLLNNFSTFFLSLIIV